MATFHLLGPIYVGEGSQAFLGLEISNNNDIEPVVVVWFPSHSNDSSLEQIKQEAQAASILKHPNILRVHGVYELDGRLARVVDYVDGEPLRRFLDAGKFFPAAFAARIVCDAAEGIHYAHKLSPPWIHGALRPETLMLSFSGVVRVSGYGAQVFAKKKPAEPRLRGRRRHIAPEQIIGGDDNLSEQTDVYLLGLCLYECITGMVPFVAETNFDEAVLTRPLPPMPPETPSALENVIAKACAKKATERYASVLDFRQAIISSVGVLPPHKDLAALINEWIPPIEKSRHHRHQLMDKGLNQILSQYPLRPKTSPEDFLPPPPVAEDYLPTESPISPEALTLPPFRVGPPEEKNPTPSAPIFVSQKTPPPPPPHHFHDDEKEIASEARSAALVWGVGGFVTAAALSVILYFGLRDTTPQHQESKGVVSPAVVLPSPPPPPPPALEKEKPAPSSTSMAKTKSPPTPSTKTSAKTASPPAQVTLQSEIPLNISFKGKLLGKTPAQISLPPGKSTLVLSNKSAGIRIRRNVDLRAGQSLSLNVQLEKGTLNVSAPTGAEIWVDGTLKGKAPMGDIELWEGDHQLLVKHGNDALSENFSLNPGGYMNYDVRQTSAPRY